MELRPYRPSDAQATLKVFLRAIRLTASHDYTPEQIAAWADEDIDVDQWHAARDAAKTQVACDGEHVLGFTDVDARGYIDMMFIDPAYARRGVATALLEWAARTAASHGAPELTTHASLTARPFFEAHGFTVLAEQHPVRRGVELRSFVMHRPLRPPRAE
ncbi:GNAT family N-acetyltransferase [Kocuria turfanensis]|uniref:GNAT family N-acetyltransferase n=1 Tax=Kocuria turfanensis TaxID=388357 RepID=UPI004037484A